MEKEILERLDAIDAEIKRLHKRINDLGDSSVGNFKSLDERFKSDLKEITGKIIQEVRLLR